MPSFDPSSSALDYVPYFEELIRIQREAITSFKRWAGLFVLVGGGIITIALTANAFVPPLVGLGSLFIGASVAFPYREIAPRRSRIETYLVLKRSFERFPELAEEERKRIRDLADETMKRSL
jgi:hypothetical protein